MQHMPSGYIRSKFDMVSSVIVNVVQQTRDKTEKSALKAALACHVRTLCCLDPAGSWAAVKQPLLLLLDLTMDDNPKVRKVAQEGVTEVMATVRSTPAQLHASKEVLQGMRPRLQVLLATAPCVQASTRASSHACTC